MFLSTTNILRKEHNLCVCGGSVRSMTNFPLSQPEILLHSGQSMYNRDYVERIGSDKVNKALMN